MKASLTIILLAVIFSGCADKKQERVPLIITHAIHDSVVPGIDSVTLTPEILRGSVRVRD